MCGIAGIYFKRSVAASELDAVETFFAQSLRHRGPDDFGVHRGERALFANLRLSIVDRAGGSQPIYTDSGRQGIVYNGEVYNWEALRTHEPCQSYAFKTQTDTESVLASYQAKGADAFAELNGMFGLCIWDEEKDVFVLARDRFGSKPLYVYEDGNCFAFASELKTLLGLPGFDMRLNPLAFQDFLTYRYTHAPYTFFQNIEKLPAGHWLRFDKNGRHVESYTQIAFQEPDPMAVETEESYVEALDHAMRASVRGQLMGEVPIGVLLSGGLDSSAIAYYVQQCGARLKTYNIGFAEINEFEFSREVAKAFDLEHVEICMTQDELVEGMDKTILRMDEPIADPACFALSRLCETVKQDVTVVLSGEGGDELFAGYNQHTQVLHPGLDRNAYFHQFFAWSAYFDDASSWLRDKRITADHLRYKSVYDRSDTVLNGMQAFDMHTWLPENLMMKADKILMAHSLEGRFPFLDLGILNLACRLPQSMRLPHPQSSKHVLRKLMAPKLPRSIIERPKMGFTVPPGIFLDRLQKRFLDMLDGLKGSEIDEVLDLESIRAFVQQYYATQQPDGITVFKVWNLFTVLFWFAYAYPQFKRGGDVLNPSQDIAELSYQKALQAQRDRAIESARKAYAESLLMNPARVDVRVASSQFEYEAGQPEVAESILREGLSVTPHDPALHLAFARLFAKTDRHGWAMGAAETVLASEPHNEEAKRLLARSFPSVGQDNGVICGEQPMLIVGGDAEILVMRALERNCPLVVAIVSEAVERERILKAHESAVQAKKLYVFAGESVTLLASVLPKFSMPMVVCADDVILLSQVLPSYPQNWKALWVSLSASDTFGLEAKSILRNALGVDAFAYYDVGATRYVGFQK